MISAEQVQHAFGNSQVKVVTDSKKLADYLVAMDYRNTVLIMMSSGNFDGMNLKSFTLDIIQKTYIAV